jgi:hypothetical protein
VLVRVLLEHWVGLALVWVPRTLRRDLAVLRWPARDHPLVKDWLQPISAQELGLQQAHQQFLP